MEIYGEEIVQHSIRDILIIVLFATLANADTWKQIADIALWNEDYLKLKKLYSGFGKEQTFLRLSWRKQHDKRMNE